MAGYKGSSGRANRSFGLTSSVRCREILLSPWPALNSHPYAISVRTGGTTESSRCGLGLDTTFRPITENANQITGPAVAALTLNFTLAFMLTDR